MKLRRLQIEGYKNIRSCDIEFTNSPLINAANLLSALVAELTTLKS